MKDIDIAPPIQSRMYQESKPYHLTVPEPGLKLVQSGAGAFKWYVGLQQLPEDR